MTTRMVMLRTGDINKQEVVGILAENTDQFCQHLYAWLEHVKIGSEFSIIPKQSRKVYWADQDGQEVGSTEIDFLCGFKYEKPDEKEFGQSLIKQKNAIIFDAEGYSLVEPEQAKSIPAIQELGLLLQSCSFSY